MDPENLERQLDLAPPSPPDLQSPPVSPAGLEGPDDLENLAPPVGLALPEGLLQ